MLATGGAAGMLVVGGLPGPGWMMSESSGICRSSRLSVSSGGSSWSFSSSWRMASRSSSRRSCFGGLELSMGVALRRRSGDEAWDSTRSTGLFRPCFASEFHALRVVAELAVLAEVLEALGQQRRLLVDDL